MINTAYQRGDYDHLYANYLTKPHDKMAVAVEEVIKHRQPMLAIDLCAGTGHMAVELIRQHVDRVVAVDSSEAMLARFRDKAIQMSWMNRRTETLALDLNEPGALNYLENMVGGKADLITCRQGIGYLDPHTLAAIPTVLGPEGVFVFNTFIQPRALKPWTRQKDDIREAGIFLPFLDRVVHLQQRGWRFDVTHFVWHDIERYFVPVWRKLGFSIDGQKYGRSLLYTVTRLGG
jgi:ubiquinone/menaquinone biosynthesis C-methylase UbiE